MCRSKLNASEMLAAPGGIFMVHCLYVEEADRDEWDETWAEGQWDLGTPHTVIWNADRRIFFGNPSFEVASQAEMQNVTAYMDKLFKEHGFMFAPPTNKTRIRQLFLDLGPNCHLTAFNRLDQVPR